MTPAAEFLTPVRNIKNSLIYNPIAVINEATQREQLKKDIENLRYKQKKISFLPARSNQNNKREMRKILKFESKLKDKYHFQDENDNAIK